MAQRAATEVLETLILTQNKFTVLRTDNKRLQAENDELRAERRSEKITDMRRSFALSSALALLEDDISILEAQGKTNSDKAHVCALIRSVCGEPPRRSKPKLHVDNGGLTS